MKTVTADMLIDGCGELSQDAGLTIRSRLEPLSGPGAAVKPATYEGGRFQGGRRWWGQDADRTVVDILVVDNEPSQANRLEAALEGLSTELGLPRVTLDLSGAGDLPPHLPRSISSFSFPHRNADAYLRDAELDGVRFLATPVGKAVFDASADNPDALFEWFPQALLFGFWQSHLGKKRSQAKLARAWASEIIGIRPAVSDVRKLGLKGDPLNLSISERVQQDELTPEEWSLAEKGKKLADIGHGQVPVGDEGALAGVSFQEIVQQSTVSFPSLRRVRPSKGGAEGRALLAVLGLVGHVWAFGRPFTLRSGAELRPVDVSWTWLGATGDEDIEPLTTQSSLELFREVVSRAEAAGLPVGSRWPDPLTLKPAPNLLEAIRKSWPVD